MDLLWITENYPPSRGGMAQSCDRIVYGLREQGMDIHVIHFTNRREPFRTDRLEHGSYTAVPVHENEAHTINLCWNFIREAGMEPDKCVVFGGYLPVIAAPVFSHWLKKPLITLLRGNDFDTALFMPRRRSMLMDCVEASESVGCVTKEMVTKLHAIRPEVKLLHTPNGIRLDDWQLMKSEELFIRSWREEHAAGKQVVGMFGHLKEKKGLRVLLNAIRSSGKLKAQVMLLLAGEVEEGLIEALAESEINHYKLPFLDRFELIKYYGTCDLIAIPSYYDGMPNVLLEAGALGIPVIGSDTGGIHDVLFPELKNMLFKPGDHDHLRKVMIEFLSLTAGQRKERAGLFQKVIQTQFNEQKELENLSNLILLPYETKFIV